MSDVTEFLLARIAEDEEAMRRIAGRRWYACDDGHVQEPEVDPLVEEVEDRLPNHHNSWALVLDPARVLAECDAKRGIVELHKEVLVERPDDDVGIPYDALCEVENDDFPCATLRLLALPYADHEDYREEWRP